MSQTRTRLADYDLVTDESPHIFEPWSSQWKMMQVIIALMLPLAAGTIIFGWAALLHTGVAVLTALIVEGIYEKVVRHRFTLNDLSAIITGMLVGLSMPNGATWWSTVLVVIIAMLIKLIPGGLGRNRLNPAVAGRVAYLLFPWFVNQHFANWLGKAGVELDYITSASSASAVQSVDVDTISRVTPLIFEFRNGGDFSQAPPLWDIFIGKQGGWGGAFGETSVLVISIALAYLIYRRILPWKVPLLYIGTVAIFMFIYGGFDVEYMLYHIFSGSLFFAASFMITDYPTSGMTRLSKWVMPIGTGILTGLFRTQGFSPEGVGLSILIMNAVIVYIDRIGMHKIYGQDKRPFLGLSYNDREPFK